MDRESYGRASQRLPLRERGDPRLTSLAENLRHAVKSTSGGASGTTVLFSGGIDSSLLAFLLPERVGTELVTVGREGAPDLESGASAAEILGLPWRGVAVPDDAIHEAAAGLQNRFGTRETTSIQVALELGLRAAKYSRVLVGQGADELFFGYAHYRGLAPEALKARRRDDLARLDDRDWPVTRQIAQEAGHDVRAPYLAAPVRVAALELPLPSLVPGGEMKPALRDLARALGLPQEIAERRKRAIQFGSGIDRLLRRPAAGRV